MEKLNMYKRLSKEDKNNLITYRIYDTIYDVMRNENVSLDDNTVETIKEKSYDLYIEDDCYKLSETEITHFITECYVHDNKFFEKIDDTPYDDILEAINDSDYDFYEDYEMEV